MSIFSQTLRNSTSLRLNSSLCTDPLAETALRPRSFACSTYTQPHYHHTTIILQMRSSAFTGCRFQNGCSTSSLSWRTKCWKCTKLPRTTCPRRRCVWSSSTPLRRHESHPDAASRPPPSAVEPSQSLPH